MQPKWKPWHEVVALRDDIKTGELSLAVFAADLYDVVTQHGRRPTYENPNEFFALTYPTYNLRELVKDVARRLAGETDKAYRKLSINYGGGKTHTLITLRHLVHDPASLPNLPAVKEFEAHIGSKPPKSRVAALCFDKIDLEMGVETLAPDGTSRMLKHPWSVLAYQIAGVDGLKAIHADSKDQERDTPPAEPLLVELLLKPQEEGLSTLVLLDEVLMYIRNKVETAPDWRGRLMSFFQYLTQAVVKVDRCAMVASLLASDPGRHDDLGKELMGDLSEVFGRQMEEAANPVSKEDVAEVMRRRFFESDSMRDISAFRAYVTTAVSNIAELDEQTRRERNAAEERYLNSFPFHPNLTEAFYTRWTQLDGFQRTRGILRTFAIALRDAEKWDRNPLISANVLLGDPEKNGLAEAAYELCQVASVEDSEGTGQQWVPILEGELAKAKTIQSETTGLHYREVEQAIITVFLNSQPKGQRALTPELIVSLGATRPDRIELEKALRKWTELSWFLDEAETGTATTGPDGTKHLPTAWRLGNRPNLRQMHHDACSNRVPSELVAVQLIDAIEKCKPLTYGASAAGAKVHNLPEKPGDIQDDGEFHYGVLGPKAASDSGKPSAEARRFIDETTGRDRPRVNRNAVVLVTPSKDGLHTASLRVREYLGWLEVRNQLKDQEIDLLREQMLANEINAAGKRIPDSIQQAYTIVVTVNESNDIHAFKVAATDEPLFTTIKADKRTRIQETAVSSEAMVLDGPYDLWRKDETSRRVKDLVGAFAQFPKLPKMLRRKDILDTVVHGVQEGIWVAQVVRPDRSVRTFWRTPVEESALEDPGLEVFLPKAATLTEISANLIEYQRLPGLWSGEEITVKDMHDYFAGSYTVTVQKDGYEETIVIPQCEQEAIETAISNAVEQGILWLTYGTTSIIGEPVPAGILKPAAMLRPPPDRITVDQLMADSIPDAWDDNSTNASVILTELSTKLGNILPWLLVRDAINDAIRARWIELADNSDPWPCELANAQEVVLQIPADPRPGPEPEPGPRSRNVFVAAAPLTPDGIQDLAEQIPDILKASVGFDLGFHLRVELGGETSPDQDSVDRINVLLAEVSEGLKLD